LNLFLWFYARILMKVGRTKDYKSVALPIEL